MVQLLKHAANFCISKKWERRRSNIKIRLGHQTCAQFIDHPVISSVLDKLHSNFGPYLGDMMKRIVETIKAARQRLADNAAFGLTNISEGHRAHRLTLYKCLKLRYVNTSFCSKCKRERPYRSTLTGFIEIFTVRYFMKN